MPRYACLEIRTSCSSCGQPIPVNGPYLKMICPACFKDVSISGDVVGDFLNDFEEEYESLNSGQGQGGTLMCGSGTFKYGYWRLPPRCSKCKKPMELPEVNENAVIRCAGCQAEYSFFPVPDWLGKKVPSAVFCITPEPPPGADGAEALKVDETASRPIVMSCPQCAGALSVSSGSDRIMECKYCSSEVYVPDEVWTRLHPVKIAVEWFVGLEGKNVHQLRLERRRRDEEEEKEFLKSWKLRHAPEKARVSLRRYLPVFWIFLAIAVMVTLIGVFSEEGAKEIGDTWSTVGPFLIVPFVVMIPAWFALRSALSSRMGRGKESKKALAALAAKHSWKHEGAEYKGSQGYIDTKYRGRDIEIRPDDDYAIEVEINDCAFYLRTEPPGYPGDEVRRFSSGDPEFDDVFPIRYAKPEFAARIENSNDEARSVLAPVYWFLSRWGDRLGRMKADWSTVGVHIAPGHMDVMDSGGRYLMPADLEPLLEDMMILASGLDAVASGREPELP
ncbi:MAG: hypothetical protein JXA64_04465 [Candidatus Fermentibacteraceae bacterium]|nr:hypothetical protein [Candidatus Fermentibacteraceae bacterium]MBN2608347.1 hypothetical protein [Candidatus Fermentibacteraceae bacterium]